MVKLVVCAFVAVLALAGCQNGDSDPVAKDPAQRHSLEQGGLTDEEADLAVDAAQKVQATVTGTFIGATALAVPGPDSDAKSDCPNTRLIRIRLVWNADANFNHSGPEGEPPDGPRKALLLTMDAAIGEVCQQGAAYRDVDPPAEETLLYGKRA